MLDTIKSSSTFKCVEKSTRPLRCFLSKFLEDWSLNFAAMLAYYILISLIPMAIAFIGILGLIFRHDSDVKTDLKNHIIDSITTDNSTKAGIKAAVEFAFGKLSNEAGGVLSIGIVFAIFGASRLFVAIDKCMSIIYRLPERRFIHENLLAFGAVFIFIFMVPLMMAISSAPALLLRIIPSYATRSATFVLGILFSTFVAFTFFQFIYWVIPNRKMSLAVTWCGSLFAACTLEIYIVLFPWYVKYLMGNYTGQLGFAAIVLLFCYYFAVIIILGAQINAFFFEHYQPLLDGLGTYLSHMYQEYGDGDLRKPLINESSEPKLYTN